MKVFKRVILKLYVGILLIFGSSENLMSDEISSSSCSSSAYHKSKYEFNMDEPNNNLLEGYTAEIFTAAHIYRVDGIRDIDEEFQFGATNKAKLIKYTNNDVTGFTAGIYLINNQRLVIAFGGTTANEKYSNKSDLFPDAWADFKLLSNVSEGSQTKETRDFLDDALLLAVDMVIPKNKITLSGHSLGGGLAQYGSMFTGIKAITLNTAPNPLTFHTVKYLKKDSSGNLLYDGHDNINFMTNKDELTTILKALELYGLSNGQIQHFDTGIIAVDTLLNNKKFLTTLQVALLRPTVQLAKLIYGERVLLNTNTAHSKDDFIKYSYPNHYHYFNFENAKFVDVSENSLLSCSVLELLKNHSISYPKAEREYKFYPDLEVRGNEVAIFLVNTFLYDDFRKAYSEDNNIDRLSYLNTNFNVLAGGIGENDTVTLLTFNQLIIKIFEYKIDKVIFNNSIFNGEDLKKILIDNMNNYHIGRGVIHKLPDDFKLLRGQVANLVISTSEWDWRKLTIDSKDLLYSNILNNFKGPYPAFWTKMKGEYPYEIQ